MHSPDLIACDSSKKKVCIFDIDNTVTVGGKSCCKHLDNVVQPSWPEKGSGTTEGAKLAIKNCIENGYIIAFATAESECEATNEIQKKFIKYIYPSATEEFFNSYLYQHSGRLLSDPELEFESKQPGVVNIMGRNGLDIPHSDWGCSIFFDDNIQALSDVARLGLQVRQASIECGGKYCDFGCGITEQLADLRLFS